ncbi:MAG: S9 family peptidase [Pyrinomonadaceae bacterium]|nr:S9 family peptidase [Pyrinomonadaceae bacterium]
MRKLMGTVLALALLLVSFPVGPSALAQLQASATVQVAERFGIERYLNIRAAGSPTFSASGDRVAFLTNITGTPQVWMVNAGGGWPDQLTYYSDRVDFVRWSPDGTGLVFAKSRGGDENAQLFWLAPDGSTVRALTDSPKVRHNFGAWSHDGRRISYASNKRNPNFFDIYVMDVATGREEMVYRQDGSNGVAAWSQDGRYMVINHNNEELSLDNDLFLLDTQTRAATLLTQHQGSAQFGDVYFTQDGRSIIFATNDGKEFYQLARMNLQSRKVETLDIAEWDLDASAMSDDGRMFAYTLNREGFSELYVRRVTLDGNMSPKEMTPVALPGKGIVGSLRFSRDNRRLAFTFNGARYNTDVWIYDVETRSLTQLTHSSRAGIPQSTFVEPELVRFKSFDGREIPAWYYRPQAFITGRVGPTDAKVVTNSNGNPNNATINITAGNTNIASVSIGAGGTFPVIVSVHGGPEGQERPGFNSIYQYFLSRGYGILATNVRGSTGYGKTFTHMDDVRKREDSVKDLAAAVDWLKTQGGADPRRIAVMGGSYGGYMTLAAITLYPELWAAAVDTVGIANFESFLKNTSGYRRKLREVEYGSLERDLEYLRSISPLYRVDRIRTPLFVIQGKNDPRVPYTEAEQIVEALRKRNAPVEYKLFEDEGHGVAKLSNRLIVYPMVADFLDRYMK